MFEFISSKPTLDAYWRSVILFGKNTTSYKFALGQALLGLASQGKTTVRLEELAAPFAFSLCKHLKTVNQQGTVTSSPFLDACRHFNQGTISRDELLALTVKDGFRYVLGRFHVVNRGALPLKFYAHEPAHGGSIQLTDDLMALAEQFQFMNLTAEVEARWRLVETAWQLGISRSLLMVEHDLVSMELFISAFGRRVDLTSARDALNGYQKGKCFYCFQDLALVPGDQLADVDHFFPLVLTNAEPGMALVLNGIWNLVLACRPCNRGTGGKFERVPDERYLARLHTRNTFLIDSHHPLRETLMNQTGGTEADRVRFLRTMDQRAIQLLLFRWTAADEHEPAF